MHVAVIGATGRTGNLLTDELLRRGHAVRVLVRDRARLAANLGGRVEVVVGDSRDAHALAQLLDGVDAVASALGPTKKEASLHTDTAQALAVAMPAAGVRRFVGISGAGIDVPGDQKALPAKLISWAIQRFGGGVVQDKPAEYRVFAGTDLDWTLVRPPRLQDGEPTGRLEHDAHRSTRATSIRRADLACFVVDCLEQGSYVRQAPFVASAR